MADMVEKVVGIGIALFITAIILPLALVTLADANLTGVDDNVVTILTVLLPVLAVIGIALYFMRNSD